MRRFAVVASLFCGVLFAAGNYPDIVGKPAPELLTAKWLNLPRHRQKRMSLKALRGRVVIIVFLREGSEACDKAGPRLATIPERFKGKPLTFIIMTRDREGEIKRYIRRHKLTSVPVGLDLASITQKHRYGIKLIPTGVVVDPDGIVAWVGSARLKFDEMVKVAEEKLKEAYEYVDRIEGFRPPPLCERLSRARSKVLKGDFGAAAQFCRLVLRAKNSTQQQRKDAEKLLEVIEGYARRVWRSVEARIKHHEYASAVALLRKITKAFRRTSWSEKARQRLKEFKRNKKLRFELEADTILQKAKTLLQKGHRKDAETILKRLCKDYRGTAAARWADRYFKEKELTR